MDDANGGAQRAPVPSRRGGTALRGIAWASAAAASITLWASYVPAPSRGRLDAFTPFTQLVAMRPVLALALGIAAAVATILARRQGAPAASFALVLAAAILAGIQIVPRAIPHQRSVPANAPKFTILAANTLESSVAPSVLVDLVRRTRADVIALPETNADRAVEFARALSSDSGEPWGAATDDASRSSDDGSPRPTAIVVRMALGPQRLTVPHDALGEHGEVRVRLTRVTGDRGRVVATRAPSVAAVHPVPPAPRGSQSGWRRDLLRLRSLCRTGWILAGDFNATIDHSPMRALQRSGCRDAATATGHGLKATWTGGPFSLVRPAIDHVLTSGRWHAAAAGVLPIEGSDHRAVWARVFASEP
jgi:endonuclease/exonuclease/phosphatase (EEP) superfamily protein YafD